MLVWSLWKRVVYVSEGCSALQLLPVLIWSLSCIILYQKRKQFWFFTKMSLCKNYIYMFFSCPCNLL